MGGSHRDHQQPAIVSLAPGSGDVSADHWGSGGWSIAKLHDPTKDGSFK